MNYCCLEKPQSYMRFGDEKTFLFRLGVRLLCWKLLCFFQLAWLKLIQDITTPYEPLICQPSFQWKYWRIPPSNLWSPPLLILAFPQSALTTLSAPIISHSAYIWLGRSKTPRNLCSYWYMHLNNKTVHLLSSFEICSTRSLFYFLQF